MRKEKYTVEFWVTSGDRKWHEAMDDLRNVLEGRGWTIDCINSYTSSGGTFRVTMDASASNVRLLREIIAEAELELHNMYDGKGADPRIG